MDTLLGLLVLAGLVVAVWGWHRLKAAARKKLNTTVFQRKNHTLGQQLTGEVLTFTSSRSPAELVSAVRRRLDLPQSSGPLPRLYIADGAENGLAFVQGSKFGDNFRAELVVDPAEPASDGAQSKGVLAVLHWTEVDGIVGHVDDLDYLRRAVETAIHETDPDAQFEALSL